MELSNFKSTFRNVLLEEVGEEKVGNIFIPQSLLPPWERLYKVVKAGKECQEVQEGDYVYIAVGINPSRRTIQGKTYFTVFEQQIDGIFTSVTTTRMSDFEDQEEDGRIQTSYRSEPTATRSS